MKIGILALFLFTTTLYAMNLEGIYEISGHDPYGNTAYSGTAIIKADKNGVYQITWSFSDGEQYQGTGLVKGNELSAVFMETNPSTRNQIGLQIYKIKGNNLEGDWVILNQNLVGREILRRKE